MRTLILILFTTSALFGQSKPDTQPVLITEKTKEMVKHTGFHNFYWDARAGKMYLEISRWNAEFLYMNSLPAGVGSNDIGLDRGQIGNGRIVKFQRTGPKVLLVQPNYSYRAISNNPDEQRSVEEAFAQSVLWGFEVIAEQDSLVLVDATGFYLRDVHDVVGALKRTQQGPYRLDASRSAFYLPRTRNFPRNTEVEVTLTFTGDEPGGWVQQVVPTPEAITVRQRHSFVQLPDPGYRQRAMDPRSGYFGIGYQDYATPISEPIVKQFIARHRLEKKDPSASISEAVKPIVYYVDRGAPEPIRSALLDGARWWNQAFEAAGYSDAFRVELLPDSADPMDARYNVIQWVHRATRGWSYGNAIVDPRTGEILKGHVTLGSLRVRQDFLIAEGLVAEYEDGRVTDPRMEQMALARIRQLSAHEVGHTLGLQHNYIASAANRASVMDYPHPLATLNADSTIDISRAYADGIGEWDKVTIAYGYQDFPHGVDELKALNDIIMNAAERGLIFLTDQDARPQGSAHPQTHLWDNGANAVDELNRVMQVRAVALRNFSEKKIRTGVPMAMLEDVLVPVYLSHRYQVEAAVKVLGGLQYTYVLRGDGQVPTTMVPPDEQRRALLALMTTLKPDVLALSESILALIPPRPAGYDKTREHFRGRTGMTFDPLSAAEASAQLTVSLILNPARAARLVEYHSRDKKYPGLDEVIDELLRGTWYAAHGTGYHAEIRRVVDNVVLNNLMSLATNERASSQTRGIALLKISELKERLERDKKMAKDVDQRAHFARALSLFKTFEDDPGEMSFSSPVDLPAGPPIGGFDCGLE
ncbi:MAG: zinc-dependent metalloprotease [Bacteroidota bacterium]